MKKVSPISTICSLALVGTLYAGLAIAGPVIIDGTDANDHGFTSGGANRDGWLYMQKALENLASSVTPSAGKVVVDLGTTSGQARAAIDSAFNLSSLPSQGWTLRHVDGAAAIGNWLDRISTANTGILYIPTFGNSSGDLASDEMAAINARAAQINNYVSGFGDRPRGGALFSMGQSGPGASGWLTTLLPGVTVTDRGAGGVGTPITLTSEGTTAFPGLTNADVGRAIPWHNYFSGELGGLKVLGTAPEGASTRNIILGGGAGTVITPTPIPLDPITRPQSGFLSTGAIHRVDPTKPTIVLTHGWQPCVIDAVICFENYDPNNTPLSALHNAIQNASALQNADGSLKANVLTYQWPEAHTRIPHLARAFTEHVGLDLAKQLKDRFGTDYTKPIHMVGHSFGTLVNSHAAAALTDNFSGKIYDVEHLTFLDPPLEANFIGIVSKSAYYDILPAGTIQYVENFFGTGLKAFGDRLPGAAPDNTSDLSLGGFAISDPNIGHSEVHSVFYANRVNESDWITAALPDRYNTRPAPQTWPGGVGLFQVLAEIPTVIGDAAKAGWRLVVNTAREVKEFVFETAEATRRIVVDATNAIIDKSTEIVNGTIDFAGDTATAVINTGTELISVTSNKIKSWLHLKESSPVMVGRELKVPAGTELLTFDFDFLNMGDGDWLTVHFNEQLLWSFLGKDFFDDLMKATVSLPELAGREGTLYVTLHSVGEPNAEVLIGDFAFRAQAQANQVPEPSSIFLLSIPLAFLLFRRRVVARYRNR